MLPKLIGASEKCRWIELTDVNVEHNFYSRLQSNDTETNWWHCPKMHAHTHTERKNWHDIWSCNASGCIFVKSLPFTTIYCVYFQSENRSRDWQWVVGFCGGDVNNSKEIDGKHQFSIGSGMWTYLLYSKRKKLGRDDNNWSSFCRTKTIPTWKWWRSTFLNEMLQIWRATIRISSCQVPRKWCDKWICGIRVPMSELIWTDY